jgi:hypothetical protein
VLTASPPCTGKSNRPIALGFEAVKACDIPTAIKDVTRRGSVDPSLDTSAATAQQDRLP